MNNQLQLVDTPTLGIATLLEIVDGDLAGLAEILAAALILIETDLARIQQAADGNDVAALGEAAHRMKGTSGSIRSQRVLELTTQLQYDARHNPPAIVPQRITELESAVGALKLDLEAQYALLAPAS